MLRSPHDREIRRLAIPALGALAAEPLYLLVDTAIVGHLGTPQLAALAVAATVLTTLVSLCVFLTYGTTAQVARLHGAGADRARRSGLPARRRRPQDAAARRRRRTARQRRARGVVRLRPRAGPRRLRRRDGRRAARHGRGVHLAAAANRGREPPPAACPAAAARAHLWRAVRALGRAARRVRDGQRGHRADRRGLARRAPDRDAPVHLRRAGARRDRDRRPGARRARARRGRRRCRACGRAALARVVADRGLSVRRAAARAGPCAAADLHRRSSRDRARPRDLDDARAHAAGGGGRLRPRRDPDRCRRHALPGGLDAARRARRLHPDRAARPGAGLGTDRRLGGAAGARRRAPGHARLALRRRLLGDHGSGGARAPQRADRAGAG